MKSAAEISSRLLLWLVVRGARPAGQVMDVSGAGSAQLEQQIVSRMDGQADGTISSRKAIRSSSMPWSPPTLQSW